MILKELAEEHGYTLPKLESEAKLALNSIYKYNNGIQKPTIETCCKIANTLKVNWQTVISLFYSDLCDENVEILIQHKLNNMRNQNEIEH